MSRAGRLAYPPQPRLVHRIFKVSPSPFLLTTHHCNATNRPSPRMAAAAAATSAAAAAALRSSAVPHKPAAIPFHQKSAFYGGGVASVEAGKIGGRNWSVKRGLEVKARTAGASKNIEVEVDKPLGLTLGQKPGGGVIITAVEGGGNAAKAGLKSGDQVIYTSSFFGDELWPADKLGFTKTAIQAKPDSVYFVVSRGATVDVKRLPKRPAPPRFGRKLSDSQKARATHICLDCGFIYFLPQAFEEQPDSYACPQCGAPKKRFVRYDASTGRAIGGGLPPIGVIIGLVAGLGAIGALLAYGLQ